MTQLLASVRNVHEAHTVLSSSAQTTVGILDLKDPNKGVLGATDINTIHEVVKISKNRCNVSATIGDLSPDPVGVQNAVKKLKDCQLDYIKVGFFGTAYLESYPAALASITSKVKLVAILLADCIPNLIGPCQLLKEAGFSGVMLDTANKESGSICELINRTTLLEFIKTNYELSLLCGIAGSLKKSDIAPLCALSQTTDNAELHYLGFRTALCANNQRTASVSSQAVNALLQEFNCSAA